MCLLSWDIYDLYDFLGYLLKKIVEDTEKKINNTLEPAERKLFLYAGHENNIASMLTILGVWDNEAVPPYCSYVSIELHNINGTYGLQVPSYNEYIFSSNDDKTFFK